MKPKAGLRLDGPSDAIVPGKPEDSPLIARVTAADDAEAMPPKGGRLSAAEVQVLKDWIREGGRYAEPPGRRTELADDLTSLRRVTLDTVGVVPSPEEVAAFLADQSPERRARLIDRLLADPRRADHWVGYWQDVLAEKAVVVAAAFLGVNYALRPLPRRPGQPVDATKPVPTRRPARRQAVPRSENEQRTGRQTSPLRQTQSDQSDAQARHDRDSRVAVRGVSEGNG